MCGSGRPDSSSQPEISEPVKPRTVLLSVALWALTYAVMGLGLCSCTVGHGQGYAFASVGGDAARVTATPQGLTIEGMNNSTGLQHAKDLASEAVTAGVVKAGLEAAPKVLGTAGDVAQKLTD